MILGVCVPAFAGTIRHDRDPQLYLDLAQSPQYASAGLFHITRDEPGFSGSGALVGDQWVLTAGHLLAGTTQMTFTVGGHDYAADGWVAHPRFDGTDLRRGFDLGLVHLTEPVTGVMPATLNRSVRIQGLTATFVGFGRTGDGINGGQPLDQVDFLGRAGTNVIDGTVDTKLGFGHYKEKLGGSRVFVADFDNPDNPADNTTGDPSPTALEFLIAQGDSGGPVFITDAKTNLPVLAGIHSFGEFRDERDDSDYGDITGHTRISSFRGWITKTMKRGDLGREIPEFINAGSGATAPMELDLSDITVIPEPSCASLVAISVAWACGRRCRLTK